MSAITIVKQKEWGKLVLHTIEKYFSKISELLKGVSNTEQKRSQTDIGQSEDVDYTNFFANQALGCGDLLKKLDKYVAELQQLDKAKSTVNEAKREIEIILKCNGIKLKICNVLRKLGVVYRNKPKGMAVKSPTDGQLETEFKGTLYGCARFIARAERNDADLAGKITDQFKMLVVCYTNLSTIQKQIKQHHDKWSAGKDPSEEEGLDKFGQNVVFSNNLLTARLDVVVEKANKVLNSAGRPPNSTQALKIILDLIINSQMLNDFVKGYSLGHHEAIVKDAQTMIEEEAWGILSRQYWSYCFPNLASELLNNQDDKSLLYKALLQTAISQAQSFLKQPDLYEITRRATLIDNLQRLLELHIRPEEQMVKISNELLNSLSEWTIEKGGRVLPADLEAKTKEVGKNCYYNRDLILKRSQRAYLIC